MQRDNVVPLHPSDSIRVHVGSIYNAAWMVRNYHRGGRSAIQRLERERAIRTLGLAVRQAFNASDEFEPLLIALWDALNQKDPDPPF